MSKLRKRSARPAVHGSVADLRVALFGLLAAAVLLVPASQASANGTVGVSVSGSGSVTSTAQGFSFGFVRPEPVIVNPSHINCSGPSGPVCSATFSGAEWSDFPGFFAEDVRVALTATPGPNWVFAGWTQSGASSVFQGCTTPPGSPSTCVVNLNGTSGVTSTVIASFVPPPNRPTVVTDGVGAGPVSQVAKLEGRVNPGSEHFSLTDCRFVYGPTIDYGKSIPCDQSLGAGTSPTPVSATTEPLEPNTIYHFRLRASNLGGTGEGKDRTFTTAPWPAEPCPNAGIRAAQGVEVLTLPDCMALEHVSPPKKGNQLARQPTHVSPNGDRILFQSIATLGECPNVSAIGGSPYMANRDAESGWSPECVQLSKPQSDAAGLELGGGHNAYVGDLSQWIQSGLRSSDGRLQYFRRSPGGLTVLSPPLENLTGDGNIIFVGRSADLSHVFVVVQGNTVFPLPRVGSLLPGDPLGAGEGEDGNTYVSSRNQAGEPVLSLLARDGQGKAWGEKCGARLGGRESNTGVNLNLQNGTYRSQGAISADGTRVYFSTRPDQAPSDDCTEANKKRIMVREETPAGVEIAELISSECLRIVPPCDLTDGDDVFQGASVDQTRVYFTTTRQLADTDLDSGSQSCDFVASREGCDLYVYDATRETGERLTQVSAGDQTAATPGQGARLRNSITAISADGSTVYFVAEGVLTTAKSPEGDEALPGQKNLYAYRHPEGTVSFIGSVASADGGAVGGGPLFGGQANWENAAYSVPIHGSAGWGGDGHVLLFGSVAALTEDDQDSARDLFRYDAEAHSLERVSKAMPGGKDDTANNVGINSFSFPGGVASDPDIRRWVSEDGETVAFTTVDALVAGDHNHVEDVYMWRRGDVFRLPGSNRNSQTLAQNNPVLSRDGSTIAYHGTEQLLPSDGDGTQDVYVLRVNGGFEHHVPPALCEGEACQGPPTMPAEDGGAASGRFAGSGNVVTVGSCAKVARQARVAARNAKALTRKARGMKRGDGRATRRKAQAGRRAKALHKQAAALQRRAGKCRRSNRGAAR